MKILLILLLLCSMAWGEEFKPTYYICPVHGEVIQYEVFTFALDDKYCYYCMRCVTDLLDRGIGQVKEK